MEIKKRELNSEFEYEGRKFIINSYDPMIGNYILMKVLTFVLPFGLGSALDKEIGTETNIPKNETQGKIMSKKDFISLQVDILSTVCEKYESGNVSPVVRENGTYGITDVSMGLFLNLIIASLIFNFKDFFRDVPFLDNIMEQVTSTSANMKI